MAKIELPPTKSSLRRLKEDLSFAYEGYDLLNQKREILAIEIVRHIGEVRKMEAEFRKALETLYAAYRKSALHMGADALTVKSAFQKRGYFFRMEFFKLMGARLPRISIGVKKLLPGLTLSGTGAAYDGAARQSRSALEMLCAYATLAKAVIVLSRELKKVQRRVNALEKIFIPQHEEAKKYISERIEEMEREEIFVKKLLRQKVSQEESSPREVSG